MSWAWRKGEEPFTTCALEYVNSSGEVDGRVYTDYPPADATQYQAWVYPRGKLRVLKCVGVFYSQREAQLQVEACVAMEGL